MSAADPRPLEIFIPYWGDPERLYATVASILAQDDPRWTLTVVDDCYPDPTVAETEIYGHQNSGAMKHAGDIPAAVPRSSPRDRDVDEEVGRLVRIPASQVRLVEGDDRVFLDSLRSQEVAGLPVP